MSGAVLELELVRDDLRDDRTLGVLRYPDGVGGVGLVETLEDPDRYLERLDPAHLEAVKAAWRGNCAIPLGRYRLTWQWSPSHQKNTLRLHDVPGFHGILIHPGNTPADTLGCILVGRRTGRMRELLVDSRLALRRLETVLVPQLEAGATAWLTVSRSCP